MQPYKIKRSSTLLNPITTNPPLEDPKSVTYEITENGVVIPGTASSDIAIVNGKCKKFEDDWHAKQARIKAAREKAHSDLGIKII